MFGHIFGRFLVEQKMLSQQKLDEVLDVQKRVQVKLGLIAVSEKLLSREQADKINDRQAFEDKRFGDIAVEMGYLTESQVRRLLQLQGNPYLTFIQAMTNLDIMSLEEIENALDLYRRENGLTNTDLEAFKSGDMDRMIPLYVRTEDPLLSGLVGVTVRTIARLIDSEMAIEPSYSSYSYEFENIAVQGVAGDHSMMLGLAGEGNNLLTIADVFAKEEFSSMDLYAFDAVCEFINCINGLYASALSSRGVMVDMVPPAYYRAGCLRAEDKLLIVPVYIKNRKVRIVIAADTPIRVEA